MTESQPGRKTDTEDALEDAVSRIAGQSYTLMQEYISGQGSRLDPLGVSKSFLELSSALMRRPEQLIEAQWQAWESWLDLWVDTTNKLSGKNQITTADAENGDKRFKHDAWENNLFFEYIKRSYLIAANTIQGVVNNAEGVDSLAAKKAAFYTSRFVEALSPANFMLTNPEVIEMTLATNGNNLLKGMENFCRDFDPKSGQLQIKMVDTGAFEPGKNVAVTKGKVIYQNELMQLIQYAPSTADVYQRPLLIIPPWINKFYILDLQPKNSLIKWLVDQGHTVFVISWVNPDAALSHKDFEDYIFDGPLAALDAIKHATGEDEVNAVGYCIGGTLLSATLAWMQIKQDKRIVSASFFVSLIDFSEPGDLGVFIDEQQIRNLEREMNARGYHDGRDMAMTFNLLRANDLIWSFYINNYLLGKEPIAFDLLYWNSDSTRMPAKMHSTYLRKMYLENTFKDPGGFTVRGVPIDIAAVEVPAYFISTEEDHIAPWRSTYLGAQLFSGPVRFVLGRSGHIAGIINHPDAGKYGYYTGPAPDISAEDWYARTDYHAGSWWPDWNSWLVDYSGNKVPAKRRRTGKPRALEDAPGSYVRVRAGR